MCLVSMDSYFRGLSSRESCEARGPFPIESVDNYQKPVTNIHIINIPPLIRDYPFSNLVPSSLQVLPLSSIDSDNIGGGFGVKFQGFLVRFQGHYYFL